MTELICLLDQDVQTEFYNDMVNELDSITDNNEHQKVLAQYNSNNIQLILTDDKLRKRKHDYDIKFGELCTSEEYTQQHKTVKAREQAASIELSAMKKEILELEKQKQILRYNKQGLKYELDFLLRGETV